MCPGILAGQIQQFTDNADRASYILFAIRDSIPETEAAWLTTVDNAACIGVHGSHCGANTGGYKALCDTNYPKTSNTAEMEENSCSCFQCEIRSRQGRTFLKIGALPEAATTFAAATPLWSSIETTLAGSVAY